MDRGLISFFEVKQCGFYRPSLKMTRTGQKRALHVEGSLEETLDSFCRWVKERDFIQTIPWDVENHPKRSQIYCKSVTQDAETKDTLLVLWKRFGDDSGKVSGISPHAKVGQDTGDSITIDPKVKGQSAILGQPMYYWFIPSLNVIATINFTHSCAATKDVCDYIKRCIDYRIPDSRKHMVEKEGKCTSTGGGIIKKYVRFKTEDGQQSINFKLFVSTKELNSDQANVTRLSQKISHIVVRDTISTSKKDDTDSLFQLWSKVKGEKKFSKHIEIIEEASLTPEEVTGILKVHNDEYSPSDSWNNIGFREEGNNSTRWLDKYAYKERILLQGLDTKNNYYSADIMLKELLKNRDDLLQQISNDLIEKGNCSKEVAGGRM